MNELTFKARISHPCMDPIAVDGEYEITVFPEEGFLSLSAISINGRDITSDLTFLQCYQVDLAIMQYEAKLAEQIEFLIP